MFYFCHLRDPFNDFECLGAQAQNRMIDASTENGGIGQKLCFIVWHNIVFV